MRLISWNCKGGFPRKHEAIARLKPDVLVLPEAGKLLGISHVLGEAPVNSAHWIGENPQKGLRVVSYGEYSMTVHESYEPGLRWILPLEVHGPTCFTLFAIWTVPNAPSNSYAQCLFDACDHYGAVMRSERVVLAGDLNNNVVFDKPKQKLNFVNLLARFADMNLQSLYHMQSGCTHGAETEPTFFMHHNAAKRHHIDFVLATPDMYKNGFSLEIGQHSDWAKSSDHMPLVCSF